MLGFFKTKKQILKDIEKRQALQRREIERGICAQLARGEASLQRVNTSQHKIWINSGRAGRVFFVR